MSKYTTGELAKLCGVSVRTVQYYDSRDILTPSATSEGGRRLYSEADLGKLKTICFLRSLDLPIDSIKKLFAEEQPETVIDLLLEEREKALRAELQQKQAQTAQLGEVRRILRQLPSLSTQSIGDVAHIMQTSRQLNKLRFTMLTVGLPLEVLELLSVFWWVYAGRWQPFALIFALEILVGCWISRVYFVRVSYICPQCHSVFRPGSREVFFARHTLYTRRLTCTHCGHHGFCVETYRQEEPQC